MAPDTGTQDAEPSWPPKSPHEALLSTPRGRQRYWEMMNQTSPLSSPTRQHTRALASIISQSGNMSMRSDDEEEEDEETLQLKLQEIQARLKLKRLQKARAKDATTRVADGEGRSDSAASNASSFRQPNRAIRPSTPEPEKKRPGAQGTVEVPASPVSKLQEAAAIPRSPSRVLLGIDKGLKAKDVSLKKAPSFKRTNVGNGLAQRSGFLERSQSVKSPASPRKEYVRPLSFNERLASARTEEQARVERQERIQKIRSNAFGIGKDEMEQFKKMAVDLPEEPLASRSFTREEVLGKPVPAIGGLPQSKTMPSFRTISSTSTQPDSVGSISNSYHSSFTTGNTAEEGGSFEPYSSLHLSKRILPHRVLARHVSGKKTFNIKDIMKEVKAPDYALPDIEQDIVIFAILAKKSDPRAHKPAIGKNGQKGEDRGKYMVMTLVDLEWELDLFLFNSGFERYFKLTEGTVVAILNPGIMPPPPGRQDTGRFSLVINSDEDTIIEIGSARDLGFCQSIKKDGQLCSAWVNKKRTQYCEFHSNEALRKQRGSRMEVNSNGFGDRSRFKSSASSSRESSFEFGRKKGPSNYDWETKTHFFTSKTHSAADLIDGKDRDPADLREKQAFIKRNLEAKEKERDMMKKLGQIGNAAGKEYMQRSGLRSNATQSSHLSSNSLSSSLSQFQLSNTSQPVVFTGQDPEQEKANLESLGLLGRDRDIHLSPVKRKRTGSAQSGSIANGGSTSSSGSNAHPGHKSIAYGWGASLKEKLANMKEGEKLKPEQPPVRKKTRFVTEKGIRLAGRESLGNLSERQVMLDDDDDDLVIV